MRHPFLIQLNHLAIERWNRRAFRMLLRTLWIGLCIFCATIGMAMLIRQPVNLRLALGLMLLIITAGLIDLVRERRLSPIAVARRLDRRFRLDETLSTAAELASQPGQQGGVATLLLDQAPQMLRQVRQPIRKTTRAPWSDGLALLGMLIMTAGLVLMVGPRQPQLPVETAPLPSLVGPAGEQLEDEAFDPTRPQNQATVPGNSDLAGVTDPNEPGVNQPGQQNAPGQGQAQAPGDPAAAGEPGSEPGTQPGQQPASNAPVDPQAQRNLDAIADALRDQGATRAAADALDRGDPNQAAQELRELADQASQLSDESRRQLADDLRRAAGQIQSSNPELAQQLRESARNLERGGQRAADALENLAQAIEDQAGQSGPQPVQGKQPSDQPGDQSGQAGGTEASGTDQNGAGDQNGQGSGAGNAGASEQRPIDSTERIGADGQPVGLDVPPARGRPSGPPPAQGSAGDVSAVGGTSGGGGDTGDAGSGADPLRVPWDERDVVQDYFTP